MKCFSSTLVAFFIEAIIVSRLARSLQHQCMQGAMTPGPWDLYIYTI